MEWPVYRSTGSERSDVAYLIGERRQRPWWQESHDWIWHQCLFDFLFWVLGFNWKKLFGLNV